jgi:GNAT superfamily N-acetyltransferase
MREGICTVRILEIGYQSCGTCDVSPDESIEEFHERRAMVALGDNDGVFVDLSSSGQSSVSFDHVKVAPELQGKKLGRRILTLLTEMSDHAGLTLELIPHQMEECGGMTDAELVAWYRRCGFVEAPTADTPRRLRREAKRRP